MTARREHGGEAGFLLAEMLTTLTISAFVLAGLVGLGALMLRTADHGVAAIGTTDELGRTLFSLDRLLRTASRARLDGATPLFLFNGDEHRLVFAHRQEDGDLPVTGAILLRSEPDGSLLRADAPLPRKLTAVDELHFGPARRIYDGGARLRFAYMAQPPGGQATGPTTKLWPVGDKMPMMVSVEATDGATDRVLVTVRSTIAADADIGCLDNTLCGRGDLAARMPGAQPPSRPPGATP